MTTDPVLTAEDYESVHRAGRELQERGWRRKYTLNQMLEAWADLVRKVEEGYDSAFLEEFHHDSLCRTWLEEAWPILTERIRSIRAAELANLDARFRAATVDLDPAPDDRHWWLLRWPKVVVG